MALFKRVADRMLAPVEEEDSQAHQALMGQVSAMWDWLRTHLDAAAELYQKRGDPSELRACLTGKAYEDTVEVLDGLRAEGVLWSFPQRRERAGGRLRLDDCMNNVFVVTEYFRDYSRLERYQNGRIVESEEGSGRERALRATITADESGAYYISDVAMLGDEND